ncbi:MAG: type IV pilus modification protein PilV [Methylovulum sp.]|jgi:type IV pilus assembly protein PilV
MKHAKGFTLIEVLIALLILSGGLLGLAALQITSLHYNQSAYQRSQASFLSSDLTERMRCNPQAVSAYLNVDFASAGAHPECLTVPGCTPAALAEQDMFEWYQAVQLQLPKALVSLSLAGQVYTLTLRWDDLHGGVPFSHSTVHFQL